VDQNLFHLRRCGELHTRLERELTRVTRLSEIVAQANHVLRDVSCLQRWVSLQTPAEMTSSSGPSICGQTWSNGHLEFKLSFPRQFA
jgi:hypothetical protein